MMIILHNIEKESVPSITRTSKSLNFKGIKLLEIKAKTVLEKRKIHFGEHMACCSDVLVEVHSNLVAITCLLERVVTSRDGLP